MAKYDWGDGKGKKHSRPKRTGAQLEGAKDKKRLADPNYFTQPATFGQTLREAQRADDLRYGGVAGQLATQAQQIPAWFDQYRQSLQTPQQVQQQYAPVIAQQQTVAQDTGKTLGLQGPAGEQDALAAKAREALAGLGTAVLQGQQMADTTYFQGRQPVAQAAQIGAQFQNTQAQQDLGRERGAFRDQYVTQARDAERAYGINLRHQTNEDKAFGLDVYKAQQAAKADANEVNTYGVKNSTWAKWGRNKRKDWIADFNKDTAKPGKPAAKKYVYGMPENQFYKLPRAQQLSVKAEWEKAGDSGPGGDGKDAYGNTPRQQRAAQSAWRRARVGAKTLYKEGDSAASLYEVLVYKYPNVDTDVLRAAAIRKTGGTLPPKLRKSLQAQGVKLGKSKSPQQKYNDAVGGDTKGRMPRPVASSYGLEASAASTPPRDSGGRLRGKALREHNERVYRSRGWIKGKDGVWRPPPSRGFTGPSTRSYS